MMKLFGVLVLAVAVDGFAPMFTSIGGSQLRPVCRRAMTQRGLTLVRMGWQELKDPASGAPYYYNDETQVTQWEKPVEMGIPVPPPPPPRSEGSTTIERRRAQMEKVMARQAKQDAEKAVRGPLALESNRPFVVLALLFIGLPLGSLAIGWLTGVIPNPFEVCVQGGTNC